MDKKIISRAYVMAENEKEYILQYKLITEPKKNCSYGVEVHMTSDGKVKSEACRGISDNLADIMQFIDLLARNYVMPITLPYIVEDFIPCKGDYCHD